MDITKQEYAHYVNKKAPASPIVGNLVRAFLVGGVICCIGQVILGGFKSAGLDAQSAAASASVSLVFLGVLFTALGVYDRIAKFGGAGTLVPITGFANAVAAPALDFKSEGIVTGLSAKMFVIAGPVIVFGVTASMIYGVIYCLVK